MKQFTDFWRGDGKFKAWRFNKLTVLFAIRDRWHWYAIRPPAKPGYLRIYFGPYELQFSR